MPIYQPEITESTNTYRKQYEWASLRCWLPKKKITGIQSRLNAQRKIKQKQPSFQEKTAKPFHFLWILFIVFYLLYYHKIDRFYICVCKKKFDRFWFVAVYYM